MSNLKHVHDRPIPAGAARLTSGISQILSFFALAEEGDLRRAAVRRGLARSTVSGHLKQIRDDFGDGLFVRQDAGFIPTAAGTAAYRMLRPLISEIASAFVHLQHDVILPPASLTISTPECMPGCDLTGLLEQAMQALPPHAGRITVMEERRGMSASAADIMLKFRAVDAGATIADRWIVIGVDTPGDVPDGLVGTQDLRDRVIRLPPLPGDLAERITRIAARAGARVQRTTDSLLDLLLAPSLAPTGPPGSVTLLPALLVNRSLFDASHRCVMLHSDIDDPVLSLVCQAADPARQAVLLSLWTQMNLILQQKLPLRPEIMELTQALSLKYCLSFCRLYEERNIRRAAERLCIVQPALTVQLHRIEEQLGACLFERSSRGIRPNALADRLYALLHEPIERLQRSVQILQPRRIHAGRKLRVGIMPLLDDESLAAVGVARALDCWSRAQRQASPDGAVEVTEAFSGTLVRWLQQGQVDLVLVDQPFASTDLIFETIAMDSLAVIVDSASDLLPPGPVSLDRLRDLPLVLPSLRHGLRSMLLQHFRERGWLLTPQIEIDSMAAALTLVKTTRYATILPMGAVYNSRQRRQIRIHEIHSPRLIRQICVGHRRHQPEHEAARELTRELVLAFSENDQPVDRLPTPAALVREFNLPLP